MRSPIRSPLPSSHKAGHVSFLADRGSIVGEAKAKAKADDLQGINLEAIFKSSSERPGEGATLTGLVDRFTRPQVQFVPLFEGVCIVVWRLTACMLPQLARIKQVFAEVGGIGTNARITEDDAITGLLKLGTTAPVATTSVRVYGVCVCVL